MIASATVKTSARKEVLCVTDVLRRLAPDEGSGLAYFYAPHTTAALLLGEDDAELRRDLVRAADRWLRDCGPFSHIRKYNPNAEAHILSAFGGNGLVVAVENGRLDLGAYQNALLLELDGPKEREIRAAALVGRPGGEKGAML